MAAMTRRQKERELTDSEMDALVVADAGDSDAWGEPVVVAPSPSPRPEWMARAKSGDEPSFRSVRLDSPAIASLGYDAATRTMQIEFRTGRIYQYLDVPPQVFEQLIETAIGDARVFHDVLNRYTCRQVA